MPVPDEEVAIQPDGGSKAELLAKTLNPNPIEPAPAKPVLAAASASIAIPAEKKVEAEPEAKAAPVATEAAGEPVKEIANVDLKSRAPDVETAPAIPEKKAIAEDVKPAEVPVTKSQETVPAEDVKKLEKEKAARTEEAPKAIELIETPASNSEVQKQIVDEAKPQEPKIDAKSDVLLPATPVLVAEADSDKEPIVEQPARQERINEIEQKESKKDAVPEPALASEAPAAAAEAPKTESNIQVITPQVQQPEKSPLSPALLPLLPLPPLPSPR